MTRRSVVACLSLLVLLLTSAWLALTALSQSDWEVESASAGLEVWEPDGTDTFTVTLTSEPTASVGIPFSAPISECQVSPASVTVDSTNWQVGMTATVTAVDDDIMDGDQSCRL